MDSLIIAAAHALAVGDPLGALKRIALREDAPALALRGTALAQLGDLVRARALLRQAARAYGPREALARARCRLAEAEIALACRDLQHTSSVLAATRDTLAQQGDAVNAAHAGHLEIRRLVLIGQLDAAERALSGFDPARLPAPLRATHELMVADIAMRRIQPAAARAALARAGRAAGAAAIPALTAEVEVAAQRLAAPVARRITAGEVQVLRLDDVEALLASSTLVIDASRRSLWAPGTHIQLAGRPLLFTLARLLAEHWPADAPRAALMHSAFRARHADESHRARLRVEIGRLRQLMRPVAELLATRQGFALRPRRGLDVTVLAPLSDHHHGDVLALLADGESWSSSALALALGTSPRTVQRALEVLAADGRVDAVGRGRACRWMVPSLSGIATALLLPLPLAGT